MKRDMSEWKKMLEGLEYDSSDGYLVSVRKRARKMIKRYNWTDEIPKVRRRLLEKLVMQPVDKTVFIEPPFFCDYGVNITFGKNFYANFNCVILDCAHVQIGENTLLGPGVQIYTATHPVHPSARGSHLEYAYPVTIGDNVWIGGGSIILPGVTIGNNSVIGAGSVVTKDIPDDVVAVGNPCRVMRSITSDT